MIAFIFSLILHVGSGESINAALDSARTVYAQRGETTTILIEPGTYQEELTIDVPGLRMKNASPTPSIKMYNQGVDCDKNAVRITWYYGHGYQYKSMGTTVNYGGSRTRKWNASVLVTAPDFYAEDIIFENSFNMYVSEREAADDLVDISQSNLEWTEKERPKKVMPVRPKTVGSTEVQQKRFRERAAAISFTRTATNAHLKNCRAIGRQDVLYGEQGASIYWQGGVLQGSVDFIFGGMKMAVYRATIVANINNEKNDKCYIAAGRSDSGGHEQADKYDGTTPVAQARGLLFYRCHIRYATSDELAHPMTNDQLSINKGQQQIYLSRPWRWWGETVWAYTTWDEGILHPVGWSTGLTKGQACPNSYEYKSQDKSQGRPEWVKVLERPILPDGTTIRVSNWR